MIQLTPTLYAVEVPDNSIDFSIHETDLHFKYKITWETDRFDLCLLDLQLLGTYSPDGIDFDCESYIAPILDGMYLSYMDLMGNRTKEGSFRSLLTSKGCDLLKKYVIVTIKK